MKRGRGKAKATIELIDACHEILAEIQPATVRAVCYRLFTRGLIPDMSKGSTNKVSTQLVYARENAIVPWEWIVDETRDVERVSAWSDPDEIIQSAVKSYRLDYWQDQSCRVEVWSEKGTVRGTLKPILDRFGVPFRVMHGYGSATALWTAAEDSLTSFKQMHVLYVGDYDPSGLHMSVVDLPRRIDRYDGDIDIRRVALTEHHLSDLPHFPASSKTGDPRHKWFTKNFGERCWELDAIPPPQLRRIVENEIEELIDRDAWDHALTVERAQVESMQAFHDAWTKRLQPRSGN